MITEKKFFFFLCLVDEQLLCSSDQRANLSLTNWVSRLSEQLQMKRRRTASLVYTSESVSLSLFCLSFSWKWLDTVVKVTAGATTSNKICQTCDQWRHHRSSSSTRRLVGLNLIILIVFSFISLKDKSAMFFVFVCAAFLKKKNKKKRFFRRE